MFEGKSIEINEPSHMSWGCDAKTLKIFRELKVKIKKLFK